LNEMAQHTADGSGTDLVTLLVPAGTEASAKGLDIKLVAPSVGELDAR